MNGMPSMHPTVPSPFSPGGSWASTPIPLLSATGRQGKTERRKMLCAVIINYRVKVLIPETEVWYPGQERPPYVLRNMSGAETDYIILDVDREGGGHWLTPNGAGRPEALFDTIKGGRSIGEKLTCRVLAVGPRRCLVECGGRDMSLSQKDLTYTATPDLPDAVSSRADFELCLKEYDRQRGAVLGFGKRYSGQPLFRRAPKAPSLEAAGRRSSPAIRRRRVLHALQMKRCLCLYSTTALRPGFPCGGHGHSGNQAV